MRVLSNHKYTGPEFIDMIDTDIDYLILWMEIYGLNDQKDSEKVMRWTNLSKENIDLFTRMKEEEISPFVEVNAEEKIAAWNALKEKMANKAAPQKVNTEVEKVNLARWYVSFLPKRIWATAASIIWAIGAVGICFVLIEAFKEKPIVESNSNDNNKNVIESKVVLITSNGQSIDISDHDSLKILDNGVNANIKGSKLEYTPDETQSAKGKTNKLIVPRGLTFEITLSDGTHAWLNAETSLEYPIEFSAKKRSVTLIGEAYFEVAKNERVPFEVVTGRQVISVLGTSFNVSAYQSDPTITTTLVEGKVEIQLENRVSRVLSPRTQGIYNVLSNNIITREVDPVLYTSWKEGLFVFEDQPLAAIMLKLARAYNIDEVHFESDNLRSSQYTVQVTRYERIEQVLDLIQTTNDLRYSLDENKLYIKKR